MSHVGSGLNARLQAIGWVMQGKAPADTQSGKPRHVYIVNRGPMISRSLRRIDEDYSNCRGPHGCGSGWSYC
jgi:hypothetical protein